MIVTRKNLWMLSKAKIDEFVRVSRKLELAAECQEAVLPVSGRTLERRIPSVARPISDSEAARRMQRARFISEMPWQVISMSFTAYRWTISKARSRARGLKVSSALPHGPNRSRTTGARIKSLTVVVFMAIRPKEQRKFVARKISDHLISGL